MSDKFDPFGDLQRSMNQGAKWFKIGWQFTLNRRAKKIGREVEGRGTDRLFRRAAHGLILCGRRAEPLGRRVSPSHLPLPELPMPCKPHARVRSMSSQQLNGDAPS